MFGRVEIKQLNGILPIEKGGTNNNSFNENEIIIANNQSLISSGYIFNDGGTSSRDIWSASYSINNIITLTLTGARNSPNTSNVYLRNSDNLPFNITPFILPFNGKIKYISISSSNNSSWIGEVRNNGNLITGASLSVINGTSAFGEYDIPVSAGSALQLYCRGTGVSYPRMVVIIIKT